METLPILSKTEIIAQIERLSIPADAKVFLSSMADKTVRLGSQIIVIGRQILSFALDLFRQFPGTTFGVIIGSLVAALVLSVPFIAGALGTTLAPLLVAFGLAKGALVDLERSAMGARYAAFQTELSVLQARAGA
jgi:hypothetical protein